MNSNRFTVTLRIRGVVQGVGHRPFVYRIGNEMRLPGWVLNDAEGVVVEASGTVEELDTFVRTLVEEAPFGA